MERDFWVTTSQEGPTRYTQYLSPVYPRTTPGIEIMGQQVPLITAKLVLVDMGGGC